MPPGSGVRKFRKAQQQMYLMKLNSFELEEFNSSFSMGGRNTARLHASVPPGSGVRKFRKVHKYVSSIQINSF